MRTIRFFFAIALLWSQFSYSAAAAFLGPAATDEGTFTAGTSPFQPNGCFFQTTGTSNPLTNGQQGTVQCTAQRAPFVNLRNSSGTEIGTSSNPLAVNPGTAANWGVQTQGSTSSGQSGQLIQGAVTTGAPSYTTGQTSPLSLTITGALRVDASATTQPVSGTVTANAGTGTFTVATLDPCTSVAKTNVNISQTASTQLFAGTASKNNYICSIMLVGADAENVSLVGGTGTTCATSIHAYIGGTTAATGPNLAANGGFSHGSGSATIARGTTNAENVCLLQSGTGRVAGVLTYVQN